MSVRQPLPVDPIAEARRQWMGRGWSDSAEGMSAVTSIMRAHQLMLAAVDDALRPFHLTFARFEMLRLLAFSREGRMPMSSARARLQVHPASITNAVARLERDGLVVREPHPEDGRAAMLSLTEKGQRVVELATDALNSQMFSRIDLAPDELASLVHVVAKLRLAAGDFMEPRPMPDPL